MLRDLFNSLKTIISVLPQVVTATVSTITGIELNDCSAVRFDIAVGTNGGTLDGSNYVDFILQDSNDGSTWAAVTTAKYGVGLQPDSSGIVATVDDAAEDDTMYSLSYVGPKRFARIVPTVTGTISLPVSVTAVKGYLDRNGI